MPGPGPARRDMVAAAVVGAVGLLAVGIGQSVPHRHAIEQDLTTRSAGALRDAGLTGADVTFTGRDGRVRVGSADDAGRGGDRPAGAVGGRTRAERDGDRPGGAA